MHPVGNFRTGQPQRSSLHGAPRMGRALGVFFSKDGMRRGRMWCRTGALGQVRSVQFLKDRPPNFAHVNRRRDGRRARARRCQRARRACSRRRRSLADHEHDGGADAKRRAPQATQPVLARQGSPSRAPTGTSRCAPRRRTPARSPSCRRSWHGRRVRVRWRAWRRAARPSLCCMVCSSALLGPSTFRPRRFSPLKRWRWSRVGTVCV